MEGVPTLCFRTVKCSMSQHHWWRNRSSNCFNYSIKMEL